MKKLVKIARAGTVLSAALLVSRLIYVVVTRLQGNASVWLPLFMAFFFFGQILFAVSPLIRKVKQSRKATAILMLVTSLPAISVAFTARYAIAGWVFHLIKITRGIDNPLTSEFMYEAIILCIASEIILPLVPLIYLHFSGWLFLERWQYTRETCRQEVAQPNG